MLLGKLMKEKKLGIKEITSMNMEQIIEVCKYCKISITGKSKVSIKHNVN